MSNIAFRIFASPPRPAAGLLAAPALLPAPNISDNMQRHYAAAGDFPVYARGVRIREE